MHKRAGQDYSFLFKEDAIYSGRHFLEATCELLEPGAALGFHAWRETAVDGEVTLRMLSFSELVAVAGLVSTGRDPVLAVKLATLNLAVSIPEDVIPGTAAFPARWGAACWNVGSFCVRDGDIWDVYMDFDADLVAVNPLDAPRFRFAFAGPLPERGISSPQDWICRHVRQV